MAASSHHGCSMCPYFGLSQSDLIEHIVRRHQHDKNFIIHCSGSSCGTSFTKLNSFKSHVKRRHQFDVLDQSNAFHSEHLTQTDTGATSDDNECSSSIAEAAYILKLKYRHRLSQEAVSDICASTKELLNMKLREAQQCANSEVDESVVDDLFTGLDTQFKQERFFKNHFGYVEPQSVKLGSITCQVFKDNKCRVVEKHAVGFYVPLKDQLSALLALPEFQMGFDNGMSSDLCYDFADAAYVRQHEIGVTSRTLLLCLYTDDFEVVNPIGAHRKKHKITAFYWTLLNIPPEHRSKLSTIQLLAMAKSQHIRKFGVQKLLQDFNSTLNKLWSGVNFRLDDGQVHLYNGFLVCALADTPAAQLLGGFKEGVGSAISPCRSCDVKQSEMARLFTSAECSMRNKEEHCNRLTHLSQQNKRGFEYWSKHWGINGPSVLCETPGFDVTKCLLHDPMHVIFEGVAKAELQRMLRGFIFEKKYFTLEYLNTAICSYPYSYAELKDKPEAIDRKSLEVRAVLPQTAASMKNLLINLPFMIADCIPEEDENWQNFIILLQILLLSISPVTSLNTADTLEVLVASHNKTFLSLYSDESCTPKLHYLIHLSQQMRLFGPLHNQWCMRFEAKNGFFKLKRWFNYRNLPKSLSYYHQHWMCLQMIQSSGRRSSVYLYSGDTVTNGIVCAVGSLPGLTEVIQSRVSEETMPETVMCSSCVSVNGITYRKGSVLLERMADDLQLVEVETIVVHDQAKYLLCRPLNVMCFDSHRNAFVVSRSSSSTKILPVTNLRYRWPQVVHNDLVMVQNTDDAWML